MVGLLRFCTFWILLLFYEAKENASIICPHVHEGVPYPFLQHCQQFCICGLSCLTPVLWGSLYVKRWANLNLDSCEVQEDKIFCIKRKLLAYWMDDVSVLRHAVQLAICLFKFSKWTPFNRLSLYLPFAIWCSGQCFWNRTLEVLFREKGNEWETDSMLKLSQWLAYIVGRGAILFMLVMWGWFIYLGYQMWNLTGTVQRRGTSFSTFCVLGTGVDVCLIDISPSAKLEFCWAVMRNSIEVAENTRLWL